MDKDKIKNQIDIFLSLIQKRSDEHFKEHLKNLEPAILTAHYGRSYCKIVSTRGQRTVYCFIDLSNGDILKAATWKAPAKHARNDINGRLRLQK
jgi:hypothetical protein